MPSDWTSTGATTTTFTNNTADTSAWAGWSTTATTANLNVVWNSWATGTGAGTQQVAYVVRTGADRARAAAEAEERKEARERARALLAEHLTARQRRELRDQGWFSLRSSRGGVYRICQGQVQNVLAEVDGRVARRYCAHPQAVRVPDEDAMLAQKLMLESDEDAFLAVANLIAA